MQTRPPGRSAVVFFVLKMIVIRFMFFLAKVILLLKGLSV